ncbi:MAG: beta-ketoacyl-ACP synthase III [Fimbriimonadaceae bacterium]
MIRSVITGAGHGVPEKILSNFDLEKIVDTNDEWIFSRTGIRERRMCEDDELASDLSVIAAEEAIKNAGITAADLDFIIVATVSGDFVFPSVSCLVQDRIGAKCAAFDLGAACAGFIYSLSVADGLIRSEQAKHVLVVGVDTLTKYVDWTDRSTCVLFGDAAGAAVISAVENTDRGVIATVLFSDGGGGFHISMLSGRTKYPPFLAIEEHDSPYLYMNGSETYRFAITALGDACAKVLEKAGMSADDVALFVPHQANVRIIESAAKRIGLDPDKIFLNIEKYGNTSAGSIPLALYEAERDGRLNKGDVVLTVGFGAGLVWGANLIRW